MSSVDYEAEKAEFSAFYYAKRANLEGALGSFKTLIRSLLSAHPEVAFSDIVGRLKDHDECLSKFTRKYRNDLESAGTLYTIKERITDLLGIRIICLYEDDVERIRKIIAAEFDVVGVTDKIAQVEGTEGSFGYKGLHLDLRLNAARMAMAEYGLYSSYSVELQIRTVVQDSWSIIDHKIKYKKSIPNSLKRRINTLAALFELADREFRAIRDATSEELAKAEPTLAEIEEESGATTEHGETTGGMGPSRHAPLTAFSFLRIAGHFFPKFEFEPHKVDGFTEEITRLEPGLTRGKFNFYLREAIGEVKRYQQEFEGAGDGNSMNPFTIMRHCLYVGDNPRFASLLTEAARSRFDEWLHSGSANRRAYA